MNAAMNAAKCFHDYLNRPEAWDWGPKELAGFYGLNHTCTRKWNHRRLTGERTQYDAAYLHYRTLDLFPQQLGESGRPAPMSADDLSKITGVPRKVIFQRRRSLGITRYKPPPKKRKPFADISCSRSLTAAEKRMYALCGLTKSWGRPDGIDAHLEALNAS